MSRAPRFIIEGEWTGYQPSQDHVVHRQVYDGSRKKLRAWAEKTHVITYTDGTRLILTVRDCKPRERVKEIRGYSELIEECCYHDVCSVQALIDADKKRKAQARQAAASEVHS